jgi:DNA repair protein RadC
LLKQGYFLYEVSLFFISFQYGTDSIFVLDSAMPTTVSAPYIIPAPPVYVIQDRPIDKIPLRRIQQEGPDVLTVQELIHLALGQAESVEGQLHEYGSGFLSTLHSVEDVMETLKLDRLQATRMLAILSLGRRLFSAEQGSLVQIQSIADVYSHCRSMSLLTREQLRLLLINSRYQIVHEEVLAIGGTETLSLTGKDVFQPAVERRITAVVLVHNHPSDDPTPSEADLAFTQRIQEAANVLGIELLDHVVIGRAGYCSCLHPEQGTFRDPS